MTVFIADLLTEVQQRLGDSTAQIWPEDELDRYIRDGYDLLTKQTGCLFGVALAPDYATAFNFTADFESDFATETAGWYADGPANFTTLFERDYLNNAQGPANHTEHWEHNLGYDADSNATLPIEASATIDLPQELQEIERATWNTRRCSPLMSRDTENWDQRYELNKGIVEGYYRDKDGLNTLRKWRVPSSAYVVFEFDTET